MSTEFRNGHALLVGVGADLPNTIDDAKGLASILTDPGRCAFPGDQVRLLTGEAAKRGDILAALDALIARASEDSTVLVFFSGHGYRIDSTVGEAYFLIPFGYDLNQLSKTAISDVELTERLRQLKAARLLLLLDCCHAGGLDETKDPLPPGLTMAKAALPPGAGALFQAGRGRVVIASSREDEKSYAGKPYSAFTLALIESLCGQGVAKRDGYVRVTDLALYTREMVPQRTKDRQHPILNFSEADNFVVAYYAGGETQAKGLPFDVEPVIEDTPGEFAGLNVNTGGGAFVGGNVNTGGGAFIGGDKIGGDKVGGDKIQTGNISGTGIAIGRGAQASVSRGATAQEIERTFAPLMAVLAQAPPGQREAAEMTAEQLKKELDKEAAADDTVVASLVKGLVTFVPAAANAMSSVFVSPLLADLVGPATEAVLATLRKGSVGR